MMQIVEDARWSEWDKNGDKVRYTIDSAPKDGTVIILGDPDVGEFPMQWAHIQRNGLFPGKVGMWTMTDGGMTWNDDDGYGPTSWRPL